MGMTAEEFWHGDPRLAAAYRERWAMAREAEEQARYKAAVYTMHAVAAVLSDKVAFPKEPLFAPPRAARGEDAERERMEAMRRSVEAYAIAFNERFEGAGHGS